MKWLVLAAGLVGCVSSDSVHCADGRACPSQLVCDDVHELCVTDEQSKVCVGIADGEPCTGKDLAGHCLDAVCLPSVCGDGVTEFGEMCDDHNLFEADECSADCTSDRTCGNGVTDPKGVIDEQCDDGNFLDHDGCSSQCLTETPHWVDRSLPASARGSAAYAYDSRRGRFVVFGGSTGTLVQLGDTLEWTGADWIRVDTQGPSPRYAAAMAYDSGRGEAVLFGGFDGGNDLEDTWVYDGATWMPRNVAGPKERYGAMFVHDPKRHVTVLFGGFNDFAQQINDTWEWDGSKWTEVTTGPMPPERESPAATFDPKSGVIVMTGGYRSNANGTGNLADTWTFDGQWHDKTSGTQPTVQGATMAYDLVGQRAVLFGGSNTSGALVQTAWAWNGSTWSNLGTAAPGARAGAAMVNDGSQIVLFGGYAAGGTPLSDIWFFGSGWVQAVDPGYRRQMVGVNDFLDARAIFYGGVDDSFTLLGDTWSLSARGYKKVGVAPPAARRAHAMVWDSDDHNAVLFGGYSGSILGDTWVGTFDPTATTWTWTQRTVAPNPGVLQEATLGFDGSRAILFGGTDGTASSETWAWDGVAWAMLGAGPPARVNAAMGYDPIRKRLVLFGGYCADPDVASDVACNDTWTFDGVSWQRALTPFRPERRERGSLTWNPARQRLVLMGGVASALDAFEWDGTQWLPIPATNVPLGRGEHAAVTSIDGAGVLVTGGYGFGTSAAGNERWELRWDATALQERCDGTDADKDNLDRCADPDCWPICAPECMPGVTCDAMAGPRCGDGTCQQARESCRTCPGDCGACPSVCGDYVCETGETNCPGDCPP